MSNFEVRNQLLGAQIDSKTGKIQILGKINGESKGASINIFEGEVTGVHVGNESGQAAAKLLTAITIERVIFTRMRGMDCTPEANTPDTKSLQAMLVDADNSIASDKVFEIINGALFPVMGSGSNKIVESVEAKFPFAEDKKLFLTRCREAAAHVIGENQADKIFDSLQDKI